MKMTQRELKIAQAIFDARQVILPMREQGLCTEKNVFALVNMIAEKHDLSQDEAVTVVDQANY